MEDALEFIVGLDCSLCSPGVSVHDVKNEAWILLGWTDALPEAAKWRDQVPFPSFTAAAHKLSAYVDSYPAWETDDQRLDAVSEAVVAGIERVVGKDMGMKVEVNYEEVPQKLHNEGKLSEILAVVRNKCYRKGWLLNPINNTRIKKIFTGNGKADKPQMYEYFLRYWKAVNYPASCRTVRDFFGFPVQSKKTGEYVHIQKSKSGKTHPLQDMVDAKAICDVRMGRFLMTVPPVKKSRKRKASSSSEATAGAKRVKPRQSLFTL